MRRTMPAGWFLLAIIVSLTQRPGARGGDLDPVKLGEIRPRMQKFVEQKEIAGAVTLVGRSDKIVSLEAVGQQDIDGNVPMRPNSLFRIASMTKPITALGIMILVDQGKLSIDDPVEKHLPEFRGQRIVAERSADSLTLKKPPRPIRIRDLLTHTSGLPGVPPAGLRELYSKRNRTLAEAVLVYSQQPLDFAPGSRWSYCNTGIDTLGRVIEVLSGQSYESFLKDSIFEPLGMTDTTFYPTPEQRRRLAMTYARKGGELRAAPNSLIGAPENAKYPVPAGGLYSTAGDLAKLYQMMLKWGMHGDRRIVSQESVQAMTRVQTGDLHAGFTEGMGFGLGWGVVRQPTGVTSMLSPGSYGHGGAFGTQAWIDPTKDLFVILLIQRDGLPNSDASEMRREFQRIALGAMSP